jgi:WD40 repeat protein
MARLTARQRWNAAILVTALVGLTGGCLTEGRPLRGTDPAPETGRPVDGPDASPPPPTGGSTGGGVGGGAGSAGNPVPPARWTDGVTACAGEDPLMAHAGAISALSYSPDGRLLGSFSGSLAVRSADTRELLWTAVPIGAGILPNRQLFAFSADSSSVALAGARISILGAGDGQPLQDPVGDSGAAATVALSPDGSVVAAGCQCSGSGGARLWQLPGGAAMPPLGGPGDQAYAVAFSPDGALLAVRSAYPTGAGVPRTSVWRVSDESLVWGADGGGETNSRLAFVTFSPDGTLLVSVNEKAPTTVTVFAAADGNPLVYLSVERPFSAAFSPGTDGVLAVVSETKLLVWRTADWSPVATIDGSFTALSFSPDGKRLAVADAMGAIHFVCPG